MKRRKFRAGVSDLERFEAYYEPEPNSGCWLWTGTVNNWGYGVLRVVVDGRGTTTPAHRFSYEAHVGKIATGLELDHLCRNRQCVNPTHLEPVTHRENTMRSDAISAINARKTRCSRGHEFSPENTTVVVTKKTGPYRRCNTCYETVWRPSIRKATTERYWRLKGMPPQPSRKNGVRLVQTKVSLTETQADWLSKKAQELGISVPAVIRSLVKQAMQAEQQQPREAAS